MRAVSVISPPAVNPVTVEEASAWARVDDDDITIEQLIEAATASAEQYLRRSLITRTLRLTLDLPSSGSARFLGAGSHDLPVSALHGDLPGVIRLPQGPVQSIASVVTYDPSGAPSTLSASNYYLDSGRLILNPSSAWPLMRPTASCEVTYLAGYGDDAASVPRPIRAAIQVHVAALYEQRGLCDDDVPAAGKQLLNQYRIMGV